MKINKNIAISESGFVFDAGTGDTFSLNETGREILTQLKEGKTEAEIKKNITDKYDVPPGIYEHNFHDFENILRKYNLLE